MIHVSQLGMLLSLAEEGAKELDRLQHSDSPRIQAEESNMNA